MAHIFIKGGLSFLLFLGITVISLAFGLPPESRLLRFADRNYVKSDVKIGLARVLVRDPETKTLYLWLVHPKRRRDRGPQNPGGHLNLGEDTKTAVKRELEEELGVRVNKADLQYDWTSNTIRQDGKMVTTTMYKTKLNINLENKRLSAESPLVNLPGPSGSTSGTLYELKKFKNQRQKHLRYKALFTRDSYTVFVPVDRVREFINRYISDSSF